MKFWDSSAIVALLVEEPGTPARLGLLEVDPALAVWWNSPVECESAIQRRLRDGELGDEGARQARERLADLASAWQEVIPTNQVRTLAVRLLRTHPLRAADSLQLAAALVLSAALGHGLDFVCADARLNRAAEIEGLRVVS